MALEYGSCHFVPKSGPETPAEHGGLPGFLRIFAEYGNIPSNLAMHSNAMNCRAGPSGVTQGYFFFSARLLPAFSVKGPRHSITPRAMRCSGGDFQHITSCLFARVIRSGA
jgi:hypothetical protein